VAFSVSKCDEDPEDEILQREETARIRVHAS
jgi:hypothetical protein